MYEFAENGEKIDDQHDTAISYNVLFPVNINKKTQLQRPQAHGYFRKLQDMYVQFSSLKWLWLNANMVLM